MVASRFGIHTCGGQPFLGQIVGAAFPLNWALFLVPADSAGKIPSSALNWYFVLLRFWQRWPGTRSAAILMVH
jgi:hypothetical protein